MQRTCRGRCRPLLTANWVFAQHLDLHRPMHALLHDRRQLAMRHIPYCAKTDDTHRGWNELSRLQLLVAAVHRDGMNCPVRVFQSLWKAALRCLDERLQASRSCSATDQSRGWQRQPMAQKGRVCRQAGRHARAPRTGKNDIGLREYARTSSLQLCD
jgi:hypothetical protein